MTPPITRHVPDGLPQPGPRFLSSIDFAALPTAISCSRLFVASTLEKWGARFMEPEVEPVAVELVRHSVQACGYVDQNIRVYELERLSLICVRLLGFPRTIGIEVWDNVPAPATLPEPRYDNELCGLALVDARARNWGCSLIPPGRVVWAELDVHHRTRPEAGAAGAGLRPGLLGWEPLG